MSCVLSGSTALGSSCSARMLFSPMEHGETWRVMCDARHFLAKVVLVCGLHPLFPLRWILLSCCTAYSIPPVVYTKMPQTPHVQTGIHGFPQRHAGSVFFISVNGTTIHPFSMPPFSHSQYSIHYQLMYILPLKCLYQSNFFHFHCYHPGPRY